VALRERTPELTGPFTTGSTFSEDLLLEYAEGMKGPALGWGRLTREQLERVLEIHAVYADLMRRTPYLARARGSNLLAHVLRSLDQAASGKPIRGALGKPGDEILLLIGLAAPPESQDVAVPGCPVAGCPWEVARRAIEKAIDPEFVAKDYGPNSE
jgi:hypothetical protein